MKIPGSLVLYAPILIYLIYLLIVSHPDVMGKLLIALVSLWICFNGAALCMLLYLLLEGGWEKLKTTNKEDRTEYRLISIFVVPIIYIVPLTDYLNKHLTFKI